MFGLTRRPAGAATLVRRAAGAADGIVIRPLHGGDAALLDAFFRGLSPASRTLRFHAGVRQLAPSTLERLAQVDPQRELALIATRLDDAGREVAIGEARYAVLEDRPEAREFALAVHDGAQRHGLGARLLRRLLGDAERRGVERLLGDVLRDNTAMLALARRLGFALRRHPGDARLQRVEKDLRATPRAALHSAFVTWAGPFWPAVHAGAVE